jgi:hypothetical protein
MNGLIVYFGNEWERKRWETERNSAAAPIASEEPRRRLRLVNLFGLSRRSRSQRRTSGTWRQVHPAA